MKDTADTAAAAGRLIRAVGRSIADEEELSLLLELEERLSLAWTEAVAAIRASGSTDTRIGAVLGVRKQSVQERWPR